MVYNSLEKISCTTWNRGWYGLDSEYSFYIVCTQIIVWYYTTSTFCIGSFLSNQIVFHSSTSNNCQSADIAQIKMEGQVTLIFHKQYQKVMKMKYLRQMNIFLKRSQKLFFSFVLFRTSHKINLSLYSEIATQSLRTYTKSYKLEEQPWLSEYHSECFVHSHTL